MKKTISSIVAMETFNIFNRKESINEIKPAVYIMDFITIIYNCNRILLIIISKTLSNTIKRNIKRRFLFESSLYICNGWNK